MTYHSEAKGFIQVFIYNINHNIEIISFLQLEKSFSIDWSLKFKSLNTVVCSILLGDKNK